MMAFNEVKGTASRLDVLSFHDKGRHDGVDSALGIDRLPERFCGIPAG
jgi:hypothetical protein